MRKTDARDRRTSPEVQGLPPVKSIFAALRAAFAAAKSFGPAVMVVTLSSGLPSEGTVAEIQGAINA
jgi:hypothetical protein